MSIIRTYERSANTLTNRFTLRPTGVLRQWPAAPTYVGTGSVTGTINAATVGWPTSGVKDGDLGIMVVESSGADADVTASGWTPVTGSPVVDIADATGSKLSVLWKFAESTSPASATTSDPGDHVVARIYAFRGVSTVNVGTITATSTKTPSSTSVSWPDLTTRSPNNLILCIASRPDDTTSTTTFSAFANANLTGVAEAAEGGTTNGDGGGFVLNYGAKATMGAIGTSTGTSSVSVTNALLVLALEPSLALPA